MQALVAGWVVAGVMALASAGIWFWRGVQVDRLHIELDRASDAIATRDNALAELQRSQRSLVDSIGRQNGAIESLAYAGKQSAENAARLLERVRAGNHATLQSIEALTARIKAPAASAMTCRQALDELRGDLLK